MMEQAVVPGKIMMTALTNWTRKLTVAVIQRLSKAPWMMYVYMYMYGVIFRRKKKKT
jgi:hypothetical protein